MIRIATCITLLMSVSAALATDPAPPNLLFIFPDQWRGSAIGFLDEEPVVTPRLDKLAAQSLVLTQAVSNFPVCSPYRAMLMTGQYPHANGVTSNCNSKTEPFGVELGKNARCWSDVLADKGYAQAYIGKWHLESPRKPYVKSYNNRPDFAWNEWTPPDRRHGFDYWYAYNTFDRHNTPEYWATDTPRDGRVKVEQWGPEHEADQAIAWLRNADAKMRKAGQPFAMVISMNPPHMPYHMVPEKYLKAYADKTDAQLVNGRPNVLPAESRWGKYTRAQLRNYYAQITGVDEQIGRILDAVDALDLADNTIVVVSSDHGNCLGIHGFISKNNHYEESMRIPLIVRWPSKIKPRRDDLLISVPDLYPTILGLMGFSDDVPKTVQGASYANLFRTGKGERPTSQLYMYLPPGEPTIGRRGVRTHRYTMMIERKPEGDQYTLHDNVADPYQLKNIADTKPQIIRKLIRDELTPWLKRAGDAWKPSR